MKTETLYYFWWKPTIGTSKYCIKDLSKNYIEKQKSFCKNGGYLVGPIRKVKIIIDKLGEKPQKYDALLDRY